MLVRKERAGTLEIFEFLLIVFVDKFHNSFSLDRSTFLLYYC